MAPPRHDGRPQVQEGAVPGFRIATWNVEWARADTVRGQSVRGVLESSGEVVVATECDVAVLPSGHVVEGGTDWGYPVPHPGRRKVAMSSRWPWRDVDDVGSSDLPSGRFVAATTDTPVGPVRVVGVCVPWSGAHVAGGRRDRRRWEDHERFLDALPAVLARQPRPLLMAGDFNQRIPRTRQPKRVADLLAEVLEGFEVPTAGPTELGALIDHVAVGGELTATLDGLLPGRIGERRLSDHHGAVVRLGLRP